MQYMENFMKMAQEVIDSSKAIITVKAIAQATSIDLYRIYDNEIENDNEILFEHRNFNETLLGAMKNFASGIHLFMFDNNVCVDKRHITHFNTNLAVGDQAVILTIYQQYGLEPKLESEKKELAESVKAEKIKDTLVYACYLNDNEKIYEHLKNPKLSKAQLNKVLPIMGTPLIICAKNNNLEVFKALVEKGADPGKTFLKKETPLSTAFTFSSSEIIRYIYEHHREQFDKEVTGFDYAIATKDVEILQLLKDLGFDMHCEGDRWPPLHNFVDYKNLVGIKFLLDNGVDIHLRNQFGQTALERAERQGATEVVAFLKNY